VGATGDLDGGGCGCRSTGQAGTGWGFAWALFVVAPLLRGRRHRARR